MNPNASAFVNLVVATFSRQLLTARSSGAASSIYARTFAGPTFTGSLNREAAHIATEVDHRLALAPFGQQLSVVALVAEQSCIVTRFKVHEQRFSPSRTMADRGSFATVGAASMPSGRCPGSGIRELCEPLLRPGPERRLEI